MLCNRIASEAKEKFDAGNLEEGGLQMLNVQSLVNRATSNCCA